MAIFHSSPTKQRMIRSDQTQGRKEARTPNTQTAHPHRTDSCPLTASSTRSLAMISQPHNTSECIEQEKGRGRQRCTLFLKPRIRVLFSLSNPRMCVCMCIREIHSAASKPAGFVRSQSHELYIYLQAKFQLRSR
jgi:hypothetical protein